MNYFFDILCTTMQILYAGSPYTVQLIPKGDCAICCPYDLTKDITLHLYTKINNADEYRIFRNSEDYYYLNNNKTIVMYIHGFTEESSGPSSQEIKNSYMLRGEENVILVDWSTLAALPWYQQAIANTYHVAVTVANFIDNLVTEKNIPIERFHVIGFSLGAEIAGLIGKIVKSGKLKRITGLDPAMPLYLGVGPTGRLASSDAEFVDVIHTDGGILGFARPLGHADFYPNGGKPAQPGCFVENIVKSGRIDEYVACSHNRAWKYFSESIRDPFVFPAVPCETYAKFEAGECSQPDPPVYMGYKASPDMKGIYFLDTNVAEPYGRGLEGLIGPIESKTEEIEDADDTQDNEP